MRTFIYFVILTLCAVLLNSCTLFNKKTIDEPPVTDSIEQVIPYVPTVYDVLEERKDWKYQNFIDSVYLQMPEQILTHMLVTKGTTISPQEIVEDYLANKQFYHDTILKTMNIQKQYIPDSLSHKDKPDKQLNRSDTVNKIIHNE
jgi:hypothetical protein